MKYRRKKENKLVIFLIVLLVSISIGYAFLSQELTINGTGKVTASTWHVYFDNLVLNQNNVALSTEDSDAEIDDTTETDITYTVTLKKPGDFYEFTVDVVNDGTIDAMIGNVTSTLGGVVIDNEHPLPSYLNYSVTYSDGRTILPNHLLEQNTSETYKVRLEFKTDITSTDLPTTDQTLTLGFGVEYVQADSSAVEVRPSPITRYTVNYFDNNINSNNGYVYLNQEVPNGITLYETPQAALTAIKTASTKDLPFYLKHTIVDDIVTESYVEILINDTTKQSIINQTCSGNTSCEEAITPAVNSMTDGTFVLRGGDNGDSYESNKMVIQQIFGTGCSTETNPGTENASFSCNASSFSVYAFAGGVVYAKYNYDHCSVYNTGRSGCNWS